MSEASGEMKTAREVAEEVLRHWARPRELDDKLTAAIESERSRTAALEGALDALADVAEEALTTERELIRRWMEANSAELRRRVEAARAALTPEPLATTKGTP